VGTIKIKVHTKRLGHWKKAYSLAILTYITQHFRYRRWDLYQKMNQWTVNLYPLEKADMRFFYGDRARMSGGIPHGNTGKHVVNLYIFDKPGEIYLRMNMAAAIDHELAHMILYIYDSFKISTVKYDEVGSVGFRKKGQKGKWWSVEVHNREEETRRGSRKYLRNISIIHNRKRVTLRVMDVRDITINSPRYY